MGTLKIGLEKPGLIWALIAIVYTAVFWTGLKAAPLNEMEQSAYNVTKLFAESSFPPRIGLIREMPDWGHVGYYALEGRVFQALRGDETQMRAVGLAVVLAALLVFVQLGFRFTYRNRLNPLWISLALLVFAVNPYLWDAAFRIGYIGLLLLLLLLTMLLFENGFTGWAGIFLSAAVLVDWRALLLAVAFLLFKITGERSRLLRPERMMGYVLPFVAAALPLIAWQGIVPQGEARDWWHLLRDKSQLIRADGLFYCLALLPINGLFFSWCWGIRARSRALTLGAIWAAISVPFYFIFPIRFEAWAEVKSGIQLPLGLIDQAATLIAGPYKNLILFVPWIAGVFLFFQLVLMDVLDRSRWLRYFIILFFLVQPFVIGAGDQEFLLVLPAVLLLSLSEALVGEEGKLA
jgi:hypothetical protein